jgi:hypothetical protein
MELLLNLKQEILTMARKSKDFQDLIKQQESSQNKQKNLEALREKMKGGAFGKLTANMAIEPKGAVKMSEVMEDFIAPYMGAIDNLQKLRSFFCLAAIAWNTAVLPESEEKEVLDTILQKQLFLYDRETQETTKEIIDELIARKHQHFSDIKRFIMDFEITETKQQYNISVASTLLNTK